MNIHILRRTLYFNYCKLFLTKTLVSLIKVQESKVSVMSPSGDQSPCHSDKEITAFQDQAKQKQKSYKQAAKENFQCSANCPLNIQQLDEQLVHIHCTKCILTNNNVNKVLQTPFAIHYNAFNRYILLTQCPCKSKITQLYNTRFGYQNILRFYISVDNLKLTQVVIFIYSFKKQLLLFYTQWKNK